jgi:hypothetical protein
MQATIEYRVPSPSLPPDHGNPTLRPRTPQLGALLDYWNNGRGDQPFILWRDLHPRDILPLLPLVFILDVEARPRRYRIRLMGTEIVKRFGGEFTNCYMDQLDFGTAKAQVLADYDLVADRATPHLALSDYFQKESGLRLQAERLALPMSSDGRQADRILGAVMHIPLGGANALLAETPPWK